MMNANLYKTLALVSLAVVFYGCNSKDPITKKELLGQYDLKDVMMMDGTTEDQNLFTRQHKFITESIIVTIQKDSVKAEVEVMGIPFYSYSSPYSLNKGEMLLSDWKQEGADQGERKLVSLTRNEDGYWIEGDMALLLNEKRVQRKFSTFLNPVFVID